jgi:hypothetical protein
VSPYREAPRARAPRERRLDPWLLALLFAWVGDAWRLGTGIADRRPVHGELGFAALLAVVSIAVLVVGFVRRRARR